MRRVVVTGLGMVTPLASGVEETWSRLIAGQSGAGTITKFDSSNVVTQYACEIPMGDGTGGTRVWQGGMTLSNGQPTRTDTSTIAAAVPAGAIPSSGAYSDTVTATIIFR